MILCVKLLESMFIKNICFRKRDSHAIKLTFRQKIIFVFYILYK